MSPTLFVFYYNVFLSELKELALQGMKMPS